jgi:hypothetical protein
VVLEKKGNVNTDKEYGDNKLIINLIKSSWNILGIKINYKEVEELFVEAEKLCGTRYGISEALIWADDFKFPLDISSRDIDGLELQGEI